MWRPYNLTKTNSTRSVGRLFFHIKHPRTIFHVNVLKTGQEEAVKPSNPTFASSDLYSSLKATPLIKMPIYDSPSSSLPENQIPAKQTRNKPPAAPEGAEGPRGRAVNPPPAAPGDRKLISQKLRRGSRARRQTPTTAPDRLAD